MAKERDVLKEEEFLPPARYTNYMSVSHSEEEFYLNFGEKISGNPKAAHLIVRLVTTPRHIKRILKAIGDNIAKYEKKYGESPDTSSKPETEEKI